MVTLLPLWRNPYWLVRGMDFPRLQFLISAIILIFVQLIFLDLGKTDTWVLISLALTCLVWQSWWILPYTCLWPVEVQAARGNRPDPDLSIITANVLAPNKNAVPLLTLVKNYKPDVLVTLESDQWWQEQLDTLEPEMPYAIKCPLDNLYGMHVYSRLPLDESEISFLVEEDVPSMHSLLKLRTGQMVRMHFLHPAPPSPTENLESTERDAELVIVARSIADSKQPIIVTGDLNDVAWSSTTRLFRKLTGLLDPRVGRGMFNTFHAGYPFMRWPLDHIFHSQHFRLNLIKRLPPIGSDHFAILTKLSYTPIQERDQEGLEADRSDLSWSKSIVDKQGGVSEKDVPHTGKS